MRTITTISFLVVATGVNAQPTITQYTMGQIGDTYMSQMADPSGVTEGASGTNVTWNFSTLVDNGSSMQSTILDPGSTPYGANFPNANIATGGAGSYAYFDLDAAGYFFYGRQDSVSFMTCSDPEKLLKFPMTYSDVSADIFDCTGQTSDTYDRFGTNTVSADGYGTLILPTGTYPNVLRIHLTQTYQDTFYITQFVVDYLNDQYWWISPDFKGALLTMWDLEVDGIPFTEAVIYNPSPEALAGIEEPANTSVHVYPNPATDMVHISLTGLGDCRIRVINQLGEILHAAEVTEPSFQLNVSTWASGIYVVMIESDEGQQEVRFVKH